MKFWFIILFFFTLGLLRSQYEISGELYSDFNEPLVDVTVRLKSNQPEKRIEEVKTNAQGKFIFDDLSKGSYTILIIKKRFINYEKSIVIHENINLGKIILQQENFIDEVEFKGKKTIISNKIDRKVVWVGKDLSQTGASLSDIMRIVPGVQVNNSGDLLLGGNQAKIFIDNRLTKENHQELLRLLDTSDIEKIEVITSPSAKYQAEGISGIINIILRKNTKKGMNASVVMDFEYDEYPWYYVKGSGNYNFGKLNLRLSANYFDVKYYKKLTQEREAVYYSTNRLFDYYLTAPRIGVDYFFNDKNSLSADFQYRYSDIDVKADIDSLSKLNNLNTHYLQLDKTKFNKYETKLFYQRKFNKKEHRLDIEFFYQHDDDGEWIDYFYDPFYSSSRLDKENNIRVNIDYTNPLGDNSKIELGGEALWYDLNEDFTIREKDNNLDFKRNVFGLYGIYQRKLKKMVIQLGLRAEFTDLSTITIDERFRNDYIEFFPSVYFHYKLNKKNEFQLNYSRRVERPSPYLYRPIRGEFKNYKNLGNSTLRPQFTDNIELNYRYQKQKWNAGISLYYRFVKDEIGSNRYLDESDSNTIVFQRLNMGNKNEYGTELTFSYTPFKWWNINTTWNLYHYKRQGFINNEFDQIEDHRLNGQLYSAFNIANDLKLSISGVYNSVYDDFSGTFEPINNVNFSIGKQFMDKKISFNILFRDLFNASIEKFNQYRPLESYDIEYVQNQRLTFSFKYNFSSGKQRNRIKRKTRENNITEGVGQ